MMHPSSSSAMYNRGLAATMAPSNVQANAYAASPGASAPLLSSRRTSSGGGSESRFAPNDFQYNVRLAFALLPCALILLGAGGQLVAGTLVVGLLVTYILDTAGYKEGAFFSIWGSLAATGVALGLSGRIFSHSVSLAVSLLTLLAAMQFLGLCGVWASLQFQWLQLQHPAVALAGERYLFAATPLVAVAIQTWGVVAAAGIAAAPFYLLPLLFAFYWLFSIPLPTSFRAKTEKGFGGHIPDSALIQSPLEGAAHTVVVIFLPVAFYGAIHHVHHLFTSNGLCDVLLLLFVPLLFVLFASKRGALWWLTRDPHQLQEVRIVNGALALAVVVACLEARVVFQSFGHYIHLPPPWNYILVTLAAYGGAAAVGAHVMGLTTASISTPLVTTVLVTVAFSGSVAVGMPWKILPAPLIAAVHLAMFYTSNRLSAYFIFAAAAALSAAWFVGHNFWMLHIVLGGVPLQTICRLLVVNVTLCLAVPGLAILPKSKPVLGFTLIGLAAVVCYLENHLYNYGHGEEGLYPSYLVILTSAAGMWVVRHLEARGKVGAWAVWIATCLFASKLSMLLLSSPSVLWSSAVLLLAISPPLFLYRERQKGGSRMKAWQGWTHAAIVFLVVWVCRDTVFDALFWWSGKKPTDGLLLGWLVLVAAAACAPLVFQHFSHLQAAKRLLFLVSASGLLLVALQPPVPAGWYVWWDEAHMPEHEIDDVAIYGRARRTASWATWLLIANVVAGVAGLSSALPIERSAGLRWCYSLAVGVGLGVYLCLEHFPQAVLIFPLLVAATACAVVFLVFTYLPDANSPRVLPCVFGAFVGLLPIMYLLEGHAKATIILDQMEPDYNDTELAVNDARGALLGLYTASLMLFALAIKVKLGVALRSSPSSSSSSAAVDRTPGLAKGGRLSTAFAPQHRAVASARRLSLTQAFGTKRLSAESAWMPAVGNAATILCFALAVLLSIKLTDGSDRAIFFVAPILLLLSQDSNLVTSFGDRQRYFPITVAVSAFLYASAVYRIWSEVWHDFGVGYGAGLMGGPGLSFLLKNAGLLVLPAPNHVFFARFLWDYARQRDDLLLLFTPLNLVAVFLTDVATERILALLGIAYASTQFIVSRQVQRAGMKFL